MRFSSLFTTALCAASAAAQSIYQDKNTTIKFWTEYVPAGSAGTPGGLSWGFALPPVGVSPNEYIGRVVGHLKAGAGWVGMSHAGGMANGLLLMLWPNQNDIVTSFRYASGFVAPDLYQGNATITIISSVINATNFEVIYRCQNCWSWDQDGASGSEVPSTASGAAQVIGWCAATTAVATPADPGSSVNEHGWNGIYGVPVVSARFADYTKWTKLATATATASAVVPTSTGAPVTVACDPNNPIPESTYDYIVVGAGAGGIPVAAKLAESGATVLLIERGPPSSGRWGGTMKPAWLAGTNLTRFDVPGLCNEIWVDSGGIACPDASSMAGCVLGGGTAINAALWWVPNPADFDENFPTGWKSADMQSAINRVFSKIPWTDHPSANGHLYKPIGYNIVGGALAASGWKNVTANNVPAQKNRTFSHTPYMYSHGERGGPMATYLVDAHNLKNFNLWMNTTVRRVVRTGSHITGVEVEAYGNGGYCGTINVTPKTGRVILSAGVFGTSKILMRSGIGPQDQLDIVAASSDGPIMIDEQDWIELPVGKNLDDHCNTDTVIHHPNISFYDFYKAYNTPIASDASAYLNKRNGILTQSAPNIGPMFWDEITAEDNSVRQLQWTARVEGSHNFPDGKTMTLSQYLGRGSTSKGTLTITGGLDMVVSDPPYLKTQDDVNAVVQGIKNMIKALKSDPDIKILYPPANQTVEEFVAAYPLTVSARTANHWIGTARMGTDSGLDGQGTSVVDTNTQVYGTDNLFVVDASIFPGMMSTNPSALIVSVAEQAATKILALKGNTAKC